MRKAALRAEMLATRRRLYAALGEIDRIWQARRILNVDADALAATLRPYVEAATSLPPSPVTRSDRKQDD